LDYYYLSNTGEAETVRVNFGNTFLGSGAMVMEKDKFELYDAYFTGCNAPSSHYHFAAQHLTLYPKNGFIIAYYVTGFVWIVPVIPLPTFVYSAPVPKSIFEKKVLLPVQKTRAEGKDEEIKTTQPVPEIGYNYVDGTFIRQGFNWFFSPRKYAKLMLSYMGTNHFGAGIATNYILNDRSESC
jgi:hypothetical protein